MTNITEDFKTYFFKVDGQSLLKTPNSFLLELNVWLENHGSNQLLLKDNLGTYDGWKLLDELAALPNCMVLDPLLELVWDVFDFEMGKTDWHPWYGQFDPLFEMDFDSTYAKLFRKGFLKYHNVGASNTEIFNYAYHWWSSPSSLTKDLYSYLNPQAKKLFCKSAHAAIMKHEARLQIDTPRYISLDLFQFKNG